MRLLILFGVVGAFLIVNAYNFNNIVDKMLTNSKNVISSKNLNYFSVQNFTKTLQYQVIPDKRVIQLTCKTGLVGPLSTIRRLDDALPFFGKNAFRFTLGISTMNFDFKECDIKSSENSIKTVINGTIGRVEASVMLTVRDVTGGCKVIINKINFEKMGPIAMVIERGVYINMTRTMFFWIKMYFLYLMKYALKTLVNKFIVRPIPKITQCN